MPSCLAISIKVCELFALIVRPLSSKLTTSIAKSKSRSEATWVMLYLQLLIGVSSTHGEST